MGNFWYNMYKKKLWKKGQTFFYHNSTYSSQKWKKQYCAYFLLFFLIFFCPDITVSIFENLDFGTFWGPAHHKTASDSLSNYQVLSKFGIGNSICDDPTASTLHSGLLSCCYGSLTPNWIMLSPILMAKTYSSGLCSWRENNWIKRWSLILI